MSREEGAIPWLIQGQFRSILELARNKQANKCICTHDKGTFQILETISLIFKQLQLRAQYKKLQRTSFKKSKRRHTMIYAIFVGADYIPEKYGQLGKFSVGIDRLVLLSLFLLLSPLHKTKTSNQKNLSKFLFSPIFSQPTLTLFKCFSISSSFHSFTNCYRVKGSSEPRQQHTKSNLNVKHH